MVANLVLPTPAAVGDEWGNALNTGVQSVNADVEAIKVRSIATGLGLLGGGDLTANRELSVDFAASGESSATKAVRADDARLVPTATGGRLATATGTALTDANAATDAGWYYYTNTTLNIPTAWWGSIQVTRMGGEVHQLAQETSDGVHSGIWQRFRSGGDVWTPWVKVGHTLADLNARYAASAHGHAIADVTNLQTTLDAKALAVRTISTAAGSGLTGGGDLSADRALAVDFATVAPVALATAAVVGVATKAAREDHAHAAPAWQAYTPTVTGGFDPGTTGVVLAGRYVQIGKTVIFQARWKLGEGFSIGAAIGLSIPVARASGSMDWGAHVSLLDSGTANYAAYGYMTVSGVSAWTPGTNGAYLGISGTLPFTWVAGDEIWINGYYEAA